MPRSPFLALADIETVATDLTTAFEHLGFDDYVTDTVKRYAVERGVEIISEASRRLPENWKALRPDIPWKDIASIGNHLRHGYHTVDNEIVYGVLVYDLPALLIAIEAIRAELVARGEAPPSQ
jgi:uncharacterized protein with HEPN domain